MDAQAGLRLCCLQTPEDRFSCVATRIMETINYEHGLIYFSVLLVLIWVQTVSKGYQQTIKVTGSNGRVNKCAQYSWSTIYAVVLFTDKLFLC